MVYHIDNFQYERNETKQKINIPVHTHPPAVCVCVYLIFRKWYFDAKHFRILY